MANKFILSLLILFIFAAVALASTAGADEVLEFISGPKKIAPGCHNSAVLPTETIPVRFDKDVWITHSEYEVVDSAGKPLPNQLLCHSVLVPEGASPGLAGNPILGWDGAQAPVTYPEGMGVLMRANTAYNWLVMFKNPYELEYPEAFLKVRLHTRPAKSETERSNLVVDCVTVHADDTGVLYFVPPGKSKRVRDVNFLKSGTAIFFGAHIHQHGTRIALESVPQSESETPEVIWEGKPVGDTYSEFVIPRTLLNPRKEINPADRYRIVVEYDNRSGKEWPAMGLICASLIPSDSPAPRYAQAQPVQASH